MDFKLKKSELNFRVYTVDAKPTDPGTDNDIAVISSVPMTNWIMSPDDPSGIPRSDGDVWIRYEVTGKIFDVLKNNTMMIATVEAWQYVDDAWVEVTAVSYQNGDWVDWITYVYLYEEGDECVDITGGWTTKALKWDSAGESTAKAPTLSKNETNMVMGQSGSKYCGFVHTVNKVNISGCKALCFKGIMYNDSGTANAIYFARFVLLSKFGTYAGENHVARVNNNLSKETQTYRIDLSGVTETEGYVAFQLYDKASHITVEKVWLEK